MYCSHLLRLPSARAAFPCLRTLSVPCRLLSAVHAPSQSKTNQKPVLSLPQPTWVDNHVPTPLQPYLKLMRVDRPIGTWLLLLPCWWGVAAATPMGQLPSAVLLAKFACGAFIMRGAGCTINDLWDRDIDVKVTRTASRPLASGMVSVPAGLAFLAAQLSCGLALLLSFNTTSIYVALASMPLVVAYPLMKRVTNWPQLVLGLTFNWGAHVGFASVAGHYEPNLVLPLYSAGIAWTILYDTIYAHQDKTDDAKLGLKSTALYFGERTKIWLTGFAAVTMSSLGVFGYQAGMGIPFAVLSLGGGSVHLAWQLATLDINNGPDCMAKMNSNKWFGLIVAAGIAADTLLASADS